MGLFSKRAGTKSKAANDWSLAEPDDGSADESTTDFQEWDAEGWPGEDGEIAAPAYETFDTDAGFDFDGGGGTNPAWHMPDLGLDNGGPAASLTADGQHDSFDDPTRRDRRREDMPPPPPPPPFDVATHDAQIVEPIQFTDPTLDALAAAPPPQFSPADAEPINEAPPFAEPATFAEPAPFIDAPRVNEALSFDESPSFDDAPPFTEAPSFDDAPPFAEAPSFDGAPPFGGSALADTPAFDQATPFTESAPLTDAPPFTESMEVAAPVAEPAAFAEPMRQPDAFGAQPVPRPGLLEPPPALRGPAGGPSVPVHNPLDAAVDATTESPFADLTPEPAPVAPDLAPIMNVETDVAPLGAEFSESPFDTPDSPLDPFALSEFASGPDLETPDLDAQWDPASIPEPPSPFGVAESAHLGVSEPIHTDDAEPMPFGAADLDQPGNLNTEPFITEPFITDPLTTEPLATEPLATEPLATDLVEGASPLHLSGPSGDEALPHLQVLGLAPGSSWEAAGVAHAELIARYAALPMDHADHYHADEARRHVNMAYASLRLLAVP